MTLGVTLDKLIYTSGDAIKIYINLSNDSQLKAKQLIVELIQNSAFRSKTQKDVSTSTYVEYFSQ